MSINILNLEKVLEERQLINNTVYSKDGLVIQLNYIYIEVVLDGVEWGRFSIAHTMAYYLPTELATGNIGVAGIGNGYPLVKILAKPDVLTCDVYDIDNRFIEYFTTMYYKEPWFSKIRFFNEDVRLMSGKTYDFFHIDIYEAKNTQLRADDLKLIKGANTIKRTYVQGEEICKVLYYTEFTLSKEETDYVTYMRDNIDKHLFMMNYDNRKVEQDWNVLKTELKK